MNKKGLEGKHTTYDFVSRVGQSTRLPCLDCMAESIGDNWHFPGKRHFQTHFYCRVLDPPDE